MKNTDKKTNNIIEITDFSASELDVYARLTENQLLNRAEPEKGMFIAESPKVIERALNAGYIPVSCLVEKRQIENGVEEVLEVLKRCNQVPVYTAEFEVLTRLTGFALTRGMLCAMYRRPLPSVEEICENTGRIAILEEVVNPTNVGANFPFGGSTEYGCGNIDSGMQQSTVPESNSRQHGNRISDPVDHTG